VFDYLNPYLLTAESPLFKDIEAVKYDANKGAAAFYAGRAALQLEKNERAAEIFKIGVQDTAKQVHDLCFDLLIYTLGKTRVTKEDSVKYLNDMKDLYAQYPDNEQVYASYSDALNADGKEDIVLKLADEHLAKNPQSALPHVYKAFIAQGKKDYVTAIAEWDKVPESTNNYVQFVYYRAVCKYNQAAEFNEKNSDIRTGRLKPDDDKTYRGMLEGSMKDFEKAQQLDPDQLTVKWGYLLKNVYHALGMEDKANAIM
jgi:tetratricopeptide (TPR) repeat protein